MSLRTKLLLAVAFSIASLPSHGGEPRDAGGYPRDCNQTAITDAEIQNFHRVDSDLYRGARPGYADNIYLKLADSGIRTIVNLEGSGEAKREKAEIEKANQILAEQRRPTLVFISFPIRSFFRTVLFRVPDDRIKFLFTQIQNAPKPILIHCQHGKDRTGAMVALYRLKRGEQPTVDAALQEARHYHFSRWNFGLKRTIKRFSKPEKIQQLAAPSPQAPASVCVGQNVSASLLHSSSHAAFPFYW